MSDTNLRMLQSIKKTIQQIKSGNLSEVEKDHYLNGIFKKLCNRDKLVELLFPGVTKEARETLPKSLKEVLEWSDLVLDTQKIANNAIEVLQNIKRKGAKTGEVMDEQTEFILLPQIGQESLANTIMESVRVLNRRISNIKSKIILSIASKTAEQALYDQLLKSVVQDLLIEPGFAIQHNYMGDDWVSLITNDLKRFSLMEKMSNINEAGIAVIDNSSSGVNELSTKMCWIETNDYLAESYPALNELIKQLHALPYELNYKFMELNTSQTSKHEYKNLQFLEPTKGCTMFMYYQDGASQMIRLDSRNDDSDLDSGIRITCNYHIQLTNRMESDPMKTPPVTSSDIKDQDLCAFRLHPITSNDCIKEIPILNDMLVLHQSTELKNSRSPVTKPSNEYFVITYFIQGRIITS